MNTKSLSKIFFFNFACLLIITQCSLNPYAQGERLYSVHCDNCHAADGSGLKKLIPPINNSSYLHSHMDQLSCIIKYGLKDTIVVNDVMYSTEMPGLPQLTNAEIANIVNYLVYEFDYPPKFISENNVTEQLTQCK